MPVTKYDLQLIVTNFFVWSRTSPKRTISAEVCEKFAHDVYSILISVPTQENAKKVLIDYIIGTADYYGIDIGKALEFIKKIPEIPVMFYTYMKEHYDIEALGAGEVIKKIFSSIGETLAGSIWNLIKHFIPLFLFGIVVYKIVKKEND